MGHEMPGWDRYLRFCVRTTAAMVEMALFLGNPDLAASWARQGTRAARMLGWWSEEGAVPEAAHENAKVED
jgi:hypothetical protein